MLAGSGFVLLCLLAGVWAWWTGALGPNEPTAEPSSVVVLPLRNLSEDPEDSAYLADGITQAVITKLTQIGVHVTPWDTARRFRESDAPAEAIARELNVGSALVGSFQLQGDRLLATLSLVDAQTGLQSWADEFEEPYSDLFGMQRRIATGAATSLKRELTGRDESILERAESSNVEAYDAYLQGAYMLQDETEEATALALQYFGRAIELDPNLVDAHVGIGAAYDSRQWNGWGDSRANRDAARAGYEAALRLDPAFMPPRRGLIRIYHALGQSESVLLQGQEAERLGRPDDVEAVMARAEAFGFAGLHGLAIPLHQRALELDPRNESARWDLAISTHYAASPAMTVDIGEAYLDLFGDDYNVLSNMAIAYERLGDDGPARTYHERAAAPFVGEGRDSGSTPWAGVVALLFAGKFLQRTGEPERADLMWRSGIASATMKLERDPGNIGMRALLAAFHGMRGDRAALQAEEARVFELEPEANPFELTYLAGARAVLGDTNRAVEILRGQLRRGRLPLWTPELERLAPSLTGAPEFQVVRRERDALAQRLRARYGDPQSAAEDPRTGSRR